MPIDSTIPDIWTLVRSRAGSICAGLSRAASATVASGNFHFGCSPLLPIWLPAGRSGISKESVEQGVGIRRRNLPMKRFQNRNASVKLFPLSIAIVLSLALFVAPLSRAIADQRCDMLGRSASQAKNCHGCCEQMKCCSVSKQEEKSQSTQPTSSSRSDSGFGNILAVTSKDSVLLYSLSSGVENYRPFRTSSAAPLTLSLARLCIRLI